MYTKVLSLADVPVRINFNFAYFDKMSAGYETDEPEQMTITITPDDIENERARSEEGEWPNAYLETLAIYRKFCSLALEMGIILFHSSVIAVDGKAYAFTAPSGTGKSTHASIWRKLLGDRAITVNDDKPLLRIKDDGVWVYGTPWNGKHRLGANVKFKMGAIALLSRATENSAVQIPPYSVLDKILAQLHRGDTETENLTALDLAFKVLEKVPVYSLRCNMQDDAGKTSIKAMAGIEI